MRRMVALMVAAVSAACASRPQRDEVHDRAAVDSIRLEFEAGENAGDLDRMTRRLAADVVAMPPNRGGNVEREVHLALSPEQRHVEAGAAHVEQQ